MAIFTHISVILVRRLAAGVRGNRRTSRYQKLPSVATLATSAIVLTLYFFAVGFILREFGVSLTAHLASASVVGLAIGFGSRGVVLDVVAGLTFIFSNLIDVGDLVEVTGQTGIVRAITIRFIELENPLGAAVSIPNRTVSNVTNYPRGHVCCTVDITLTGDELSRAAATDNAVILMHSTAEQFPGILIGIPSCEGHIKHKSGKEILRLRFGIWPDRGKPIETTFCEE